MTRRSIGIRDPDAQPRFGANSVPKSVMSSMSGRTQSKTAHPPLLQVVTYPMHNGGINLGLCLGGVPLPDMHRAILARGWKLIPRSISPGRSKDCWAVYTFFGEGETPDINAISVVHNMLMLMHETELLLTWKEVDTEWKGVDNWIRELK